MHKILLTFISATFVATTFSQQVKLPVGKKFQMITDVKSTSTATAAGQDVDMYNTSIVYIDHELKSATENKLVLGLVIKKVTGSVSMMGQEQNFDSDDSSFRANPGFEESFRMLGKETEVIVENGKVLVRGELEEAAKIISGDNGDANDMGRVFLLLADSLIKPGYTWTNYDSSEAATTETNQLIYKVTDSSVEVLVNSKLRIANTISKNGMEVKQQTEGTVKASRIYNRSTGLLMTETATSEIKGNMDVMGQQIPLNSKQDIKTTVRVL